MARNAPSELPAIARALRASRRAAKFTNARKLLEAIEASGRHAPSYSTYAQWESGEVEPREDTLRPVIDFHRANGTWRPVDDAPDLAKALMALASSTQAMAEELAALRQERESLTDRLADLEATVRLLAQQGLAGLGTAAPPTPETPDP